MEATEVVVVIVLVVVVVGVMLTEEELDADPVEFIVDVVEAVMEVRRPVPGTSVGVVSVGEDRGSSPILTLGVPVTTGTARAATA